MNPGTLPGDLPILQYMPQHLVGLIAPEQFMYLSGLTGLLSGFLVLLIWSRGL